MPPPTPSFLVNLQLLTQIGDDIATAFKSRQPSHSVESVKSGQDHCNQTVEIRPLRQQLSSNMVKAKKTIAEKRASPNFGSALAHNWQFHHAPMVHRKDDKKSQSGGSFDHPPANWQRAKPPDAGCKLHQRRVTEGFYLPVSTSQLVEHCTLCLSILSGLRLGSYRSLLGSMLMGDWRWPLLHNIHWGLIKPQKDGPIEKN